MTLFLLHLFAWVIPQWERERRFRETSCRILQSRLGERVLEERPARGTVSDESLKTGSNKKNERADLESTENDAADLPRSETPAEKARTLFRAEFEIAYVVSGAEYTVQIDGYRRLESTKGFSPDRRQVERLLERFPVGKEATCYYWVDAPEYAVLLLPPRHWEWFLQGLTVALILFGAIGFWWTIRHRSISEERRAAKELERRVPALGKSGNAPDRWPTVPAIGGINDSPGTDLTFRLPTGEQASRNLFFTVFLALSWNAAAWSGLIYALWTWNGGVLNTLICVLFALGFCGFGLYLLMSGIQQLLVAFGCGPTLFEISDHPIIPGRRYRLLIVQPGVFRVVRLELLLICEEVARYRQGTDTITHRKEVFRHELLVREDFETTRDAPIKHELLLRLPHGAMHSMRCLSNEVNWKFVIHAQLSGWPDLYRECPIVVVPSTIRERHLEEE